MRSVIAVIFFSPLRRPGTWPRRKGRLLPDGTQARTTQDLRGSSSFGDEWTIELASLSVQANLPAISIVSPGRVTSLLLDCPEPIAVPIGATAVVAVFSSEPPTEPRPRSLKPTYPLLISSVPTTSLSISSA